VIGVKKDADGIYYWTLDGEWITDSEGNKIPTTGKDGTDGEDGSAARWFTGEGAPTIVSGSNNGDMYLDTTTLNVYQRVDNGDTETWNPQCNIKGSDGTPGTAINFNFKATCKRFRLFTRKENFS
jgi:hypothetical protein